MPVNSNFTLPKAYREIDDANLWPITNVESFGARGDGVTDDTTAFQNAANAGWLQLVTGKTYVTGKVNFPSNSGVIGNGATWKKKNALNDNLIVITGDNTSIINTFFDGNKSNQTVVNKSLIVTDNISHSGTRILFNTFQNNYQYHLATGYIDNQLILGNNFLDSDGGAQVGIGAGTNINIIGNRFTNYGKATGSGVTAASVNAIWLPGATYGVVTDVVISGNTFKTTAYFAARVTAVSSNVITVSIQSGTMPLSGDPIVFTTFATAPTGITQGTTYYCIPLSASTFSVSATQSNGVPGSVVTLTNSTGIGALCWLARTIALVEGNNVVGLTINGNQANGGVYGLSVGSCDRVSIGSNTIQNQVIYGVELGNATTGTQTLGNNTFVDCSSGINFTSTSQIATITGNTFTHTSACPLPGQHISPQGRRITVSGNTLINCSDISIKSITDVEDLTVVGNNMWMDNGRPTFGATTPQDPIFFNAAGSSRGLKVFGNNVDVSVDGGASSNNNGTILLSGTTHYDYEIANNKLTGQISGATTSGRIRCIGIHLLSGVHRNAQIKNNTVSGFNTGISTAVSTIQGISVVDNQIYNNATNYNLNGREVVRYGFWQSANLGGAGTINTTGDQTNGWTTVLNVASVDRLTPGMDIWLNAVIKTITAVTGGGTISQSVSSMDLTNNWVNMTNGVVPPAGTAIKFTTTGALPNGLSTTTTYYVIPLDVGKFYVTSGQTGYADAISRNTANIVALGSGGSGTHTIVNAPTFLISSTAGSTSAGVSVKNDSGSQLSQGAGFTALGRIAETVGASPATWQNTTGVAKDIVYSGGASVTLVDLSQDGSTWSNAVTQTGAAITFQRTIQPGCWTRVTYTSTAPILTSFVTGA